MALEAYGVITATLALLPLCRGKSHEFIAG
jgi:hypothetical protein